MIYQFRVSHDSIRVHAESEEAAIAAAIAMIRIRPEDPSENWATLADFGPDGPALMPRSTHPAVWHSVPGFGFVATNGHVLVLESEANRGVASTGVPWKTWPAGSREETDACAMMAVWLSEPLGTIIDLARRGRYTPGVQSVHEAGDIVVNSQYAEMFPGCEWYAQPNAPGRRLHVSRDGALVGAVMPLSPDIDLLPIAERLPRP